MTMHSTRSLAVIKITLPVNKTATVGKKFLDSAAVSSATYNPVLPSNTIVQQTMVMK